MVSENMAIVGLHVSWDYCVQVLSMQLMSCLKYTGTEVQIIRGNRDNLEIISDFLSIKPYFMTYH